MSARGPCRDDSFLARRWVRDNLRQCELPDKLDSPKVPRTAFAISVVTSAILMTVLQDR